MSLGLGHLIVFGATFFLAGAVAGFSSGLKRSGEVCLPAERLECECVK